MKELTEKDQVSFVVLRKQQSEYVFHRGQVQSEISAG